MIQIFSNSLLAIALHFQRENVTNNLGGIVINDQFVSVLSGFEVSITRKCAQELSLTSLQSKLLPELFG